MAKTWETLFNLTGFMKYLLAEVLPEEKVESPVYVLDSLHELLMVTIACIEKVKSISNKKSQLTNDNLLHKILLGKNNEAIEGYAKNILKTEAKSVSNLSEKPIPKEEYVINDSAINLKDKSKYLSQNFIKLSKEMHNGRPFGYYCRPCDEVIYMNKLWEKHNSDKLHSFLNENCETKHASCTYCNLIVFSTFADAEHLFTYHQKDHHIQSQNTGVPKIKIRQNSKQLNDGAKSLESTDLSPDKIISISPVFIELDKLMHSKNGRGFYCHTCDKSFDTVTRWNKHFQDEDAHMNTADTSDWFHMCDKCKLIMFAEPSVQIVYKAYHGRGHSHFTDEDKSNRSSRKSSMENIHLASRDQSGHERSSRQEGKGNRNKVSTNHYVIAEKFMDLNTAVHSSNLQGWYYCRPCNTTSSPEAWAEHSSDMKHLRLMSSHSFINWKGICAYCSLTLIGTRDTVKNYMGYHTKGHNLVLSYDEERISTGRVHRRRNKKGLFLNDKKHSRSNSVSTVGGDDDIGEDDNDEEEDDEWDNDETEETENRPVPVTLDSTSTESSWYSSSKEEQLHFLVFQLVNSRIEQKQKCGKTEFGAVCMPCEITVDSAFAWQDHLYSQDHRQKVSNNDKQALIKDLNVVLFGNIDVLEKYSTLIKGNTIFIET